MNSSASRYNRVYFSVVLVAVSLVLLINYAVDPLSRFRLNEKIYYSVERELKPKLLAADNYEGLILGSSKATYFQTENLGVSGKVLNAAFSAAVPEEIYYFLRDNEPDVKWLAIALDFYMFNGNAFPWKENLASDDGVSDFSYLVSIDTLEYSVRTVRNRIQKRPANYTGLGAANAIFRERGDIGVCCYYKKDLELLKSHHFSSFHISKERFNVLREIKKWADKREIAVFVWINPYNHMVYELAEKMIPNEMDVIRNEIKNIFSRSKDLSKDYSDISYYWKNDPYHFYPSTAELLFRDNFADDISDMFPD